MSHGILPFSSPPSTRDGKSAAICVAGYCGTRKGPGNMLEEQIFTSGRGIAMDLDIFLTALHVVVDDLVK